MLFLSALGQVDDRVRGLKAGGDDYLTKPFAFAELLARVEALTRRGKSDGPVTKLAVGDLEMDLLSRSVRRAGQKIDLQPREFRLLEYLMRHAGQVVTRTMLLEGVWDYHFDPQTNVIDVHVSRLRQKIDKPFADAADPHGAQRRLHAAGAESEAERAGLNGDHRRPARAAQATPPAECRAARPMRLVRNRRPVRSAGVRFGLIYAGLFAPSARWR